MAPGTLCDMARPASLQPSFEDLGTPLSEVTFCVVDLETTGGGADSSITEIGAVKVRGGEILGEFQTLVRPSGPIPALIQVLTGITDRMVADAPTLSQALPAFRSFAAGCVLVAHNAPFDVGFLRRAHEELGLDWRRPRVVDTVRLARCTLLTGEVPNCKLTTLSAHFRATTIPNHRALSDARATVDVLHALLERAGSFGVSTWEELDEFTGQVSPERRAKRVWAQEAPRGPGVYWFRHRGRDADGVMRDEVLYVGKSKDVRTRVRSYFSAAEQRSRIKEMVRIATGMGFLRCSTHLEAEVRELRMIQSHSPRYNRRSRNQTRIFWLRLTTEAFPRLAVVRKCTERAAHWGPFTSAAAAEEAALVLQDALGVRGCKQRLSSSRPSPECALAEMGRCPAPCRLGPDADRYREVTDAVLRTWAGDVRPVLGAGAARLARLVASERFEEAAEVTSRLLAFHQTSVRFHRLSSLSSCAEIVAAAPEGDGWAVHVVRHGRLAAAAWAPTADVPGVAAALPAAAETVLPQPGGLPAGSIEEAQRIAAWLETPGVRLLAADGDWAWPMHAGMDDAALAREITCRGGAVAVPDLAFGALSPA